MIAQRNLSLLANRLARSGGLRIPESVLERDYCLAWFLVGLSRVALREQLVFKGGTALKRCYFGDYRFSEDLDFSLTEETALNAIQTGLEQVYVWVRQASGIRFYWSRSDSKQHQNCHTFYLAYEGPLPATAPKEVKVDITIHEHIVCPLQERFVLQGYEEYDDLPDGRSIRVYSLDEIVIEKIADLTDRARNEPRDLYDVWFLTSKGHVELDLLIPELDSKLKVRGRSRKLLQTEFSRKLTRLKKLWQLRLGSQLPQLPPFEDVWRAVNRTFRTACLAAD